MLKKVLETLLKTSQSAQFQTASTNRPKVRQGFYKYFFYSTKMTQIFYDLLRPISKKSTKLAY